ncbi:MAG TPA: hypothetical protein VFE63_06570, partial [Roseiarcus sp.]|nr:hypothetical protein [Roseiarcus sp.]
MLHRTIWISQLSAEAHIGARLVFALSFWLKIPVVKEIVMSTLQRISINAVTAFVLGAVGVSAGELPKWEVAGFPISPNQIAVLGSDRIQEQSPTPTLTLNGMPASPHQIAVLHR